MMITANCIRKTKGKCSIAQQGQSTMLVDRYQKEFLVNTCCKHCYNIIYNSVPLSLHQFLDGIAKDKPASMRLLFTTESGAETEDIITYFDKMREGTPVSLPYREYTNGHYKRGVE